MKQTHYRGYLRMWKPIYPWKPIHRVRIWRAIAGLMLSTGLTAPLVASPAQAQLQAYCRRSPEVSAQKSALRQQALSGDRLAEQQYKTLLRQHAEQLAQCRNTTWPRRQALWIRLYPCDAQRGSLDRLFDQVMDWGYNEVYIETFYNGIVLLPESGNPTPWPSVIRHPNHRNVDLLAEAIAKGHERGMKVYSWMFSMNYGYSYAQRGDRQDSLARNGQGQTSLAASNSGGSVGSEEAFIDPYSMEAKQDYAQLLQLVLQRRPDGVLFDYIRYPRGEGGASVASRVQDLWIYGQASQQALYSRASNQSGRELIRRFVSRGNLTDADLTDVQAQFPNEGDALWQGRTPTVSPSAPIGQRRAAIQSELWRLSVAHAMQGVLDFLNFVANPVQQQQLSVGAVFFPRANAPVREGYDSRLQPWDRFPQNIEWHPMAYGVCGTSSCIIEEIQRVLAAAGSASMVKPVLAGVWGSPISNRPSLEVQMAAIQQTTPQVQAISHFAYSWQDPETDRERKFCQLR